MAKTTSSGREASLTLPWPPTVNTYWRIDWRSRVVYMTQKARRYREFVAAKLGHEPIEPFRGPVGVQMLCHPKDDRIRDLDNLPKGVLDSLTYAGVWSDDSQVDELHIVRGAVKSGGSIDLTIWELPTEGESK